MNSHTIKKYDLVIVGGGALGTFHAYHALERGLTVALVEKDKLPMSATVRNFGQVVPSGMNTRWQQYGRKSLEIYKTLQNKTDISVRQNGSVYLASDAEEQTLLEELHTINNNNSYPSLLLSKEECLQRFPGLRAGYVTAGLFFPEEVTVEPGVMISKVINYLISEKGLAYYGSRHIIACENKGHEVVLRSSTGESFTGAKAIICCGSEFKTLYPDIFAGSDLEVVKLQMLRTVPQTGYALKGSILTGLSIRRYEAFRECPSYQTIKTKEPQESFEKKWGIHILFKQATDGSVIIGDSHEYAAVTDTDDLGFELREEVDAFMIAEAKKIIDLPSYNIQNRWYGIYSQCKQKDIFRHTISDNIHIITGIGGKGMTGAAGFSAHSIHNIFQ